MASSHVVASHITKLLSSFRQILQFRFRANRQGRIPPWKVTKTRPFLSTCYGYPSTTEVPPCCQAATKKLTFSTTSVLLLLNVPLSLSRGTVFRRPKNPRRGYRPKIAGILFVCNEPEGKYYTVPYSGSWPMDLAKRAKVVCGKVTILLWFQSPAQVSKLSTSMSFMRAGDMYTLHIYTGSFFELQQLYRWERLGLLILLTKVGWVPSLQLSWQHTPVI